MGRALIATGEGWTVRAARLLVAAVLARTADAGASVAIVLASVRQFGGPAQGSLVIALLLVPHVVAGPFVGLFTDRARRPRVVHACFVGGFGVALGGVLLLLGHVPQPAVLGLALVAGCCGPMIFGGLSSRLDDVVVVERRQRFRGLDAATYNVAEIAGPAAAAALVVAAGVPVSAGVLAVVCLAAAGLLLTVRAIAAEGGAGRVGVPTDGEKVGGNDRASVGDEELLGVGAPSAGGAATVRVDAGAVGGDAGPVDGGAATDDLGIEPVDANADARTGDAAGASVRTSHGAALATVHGTDAAHATGHGVDGGIVAGHGAGAGHATGHRVGGDTGTVGGVGTVGSGNATAGPDGGSGNATAGPDGGSGNATAGPDSGGRGRFGEDLRAGLRAIVVSRPLLAVTAASCVASLGMGMLTPVAVLLGVAHGHPTGGGLLITATGMGALCGSLLVARWPVRVAPHVLVLVCLVVAGAVLAVAGFVGSWAALVVVFAVAGFCDGPLLTSVLQVRSTEAPARVRTQVFTLGAGLKLTAAAVGAAGFAGLAGWPVGALTLGVAGTQFVAAAVGAGLLGIRGVRGRRSLPAGR